MTGLNYRVRRATLDDLGALRPIWESMRLPVAELEKRLTEFQLAEDSSGEIVGAVGFQIVGRYARIHSEAFSDFSATDAVRPMFLERIQALAMNHGIVRLWTREQAPFWKQNGFVSANDEVLKKIPEAWADADAAWLTLALKDEQTIVSMEKELAMFMEAEKLRTRRAFQQARTLKMIATAVAILFAIFVIGVGFYMLRHNVGFLHPRR
ncbi:MAG TPA: hypothetical protein VFM25_09830 [Verrucomicrobiae bacterium]|nr:hypothetical protein [Verrucomicrobiae bacterium]